MWKGVVKGFGNQTREVHFKFLDEAHSSIQLEKANYFCLTGQLCCILFYYNFIKLIPEGLEQPARERARLSSGFDFESAATTSLIPHICKLEV